MVPPHRKTPKPTFRRTVRASLDFGLLEARQRRVREERPQLAGCGPAAGRSENRAASRPERLKPAPQALRAKNKNTKYKIQNHLRSPSPISNLQRHILPDPVRSPISISNLQSPISTCGGGVSGGESTSFQGDALFLSHLQADLHPLFAPFCNLQSATRFSRRLWREVNISVSGLRSRGADGGSSRSLSSVKDL